MSTKCSLLHGLSWVGSLFVIAALGCAPAVTPDPDAGDSTDAGDVADAGDPTDAGHTGPSGSVRVTVTSATGDAVANARVSVVGTGLVINSDASGEALLTGVAAGESVAVAASTAQSVVAYAVVTPVEDGEVSASVVVPATVAASVTPAASPQPVTLGGVRVEVPASGGLVTPSGSAYSGAVSVRVADLSPSDVVAPLPSTIVGEQAVVEAPVTQFDVSLFGADGTPLQLATGARMPFQRALVLDDETLDALQTNDLALTLKRFDPETGAWIATDVTLAYENGVVSGALDHLSIYGVFSTGYHFNSFEIPSGCATGRVTRAGVAVPSIALVYRMQIFPFGRHRLPVYFEERATTDATGAFCLKLPRAGQPASLVARIGTRPIRTWAAEVLPLAFTIDGKNAPLPAPVTSGDAACAPGATCAELDELLYPGTAAVVRPRCATVPLLCDDKNPCTTDTCVPDACAANTSCSGCANVVSMGACDDGDSCTTGDSCASGLCKGTPVPPTSTPIVTVTAGTPNPPALTKQSAATRTEIDDTFAGPGFDTALWKAPHDPTVTFSNGSVRVGTGNGVFLRNHDRAWKLGGAFELALTFTPLQATDVHWSLNVNAAAAASIQVSPTGEAMLSASPTNGGGAPETANVTLTSGTSYVLVLRRTSASVVEVSIQTPARVSVAGPLLITEPSDFDLSISANGSVQTGAADFVSLDELSTDLTVEVPTLWTLSGSPLTAAGTDYDDSPFGTSGSTVFWLDPSERDGLTTSVTDGGDVTLLRFTGWASTIRAYLLTVTTPGGTLLVTVYSPFDDATSRRHLDQFVGAGSFTIDASVAAFHRESNGTYRFELERNVVACVQPAVPSAGPVACTPPSGAHANACNCHCGFIASSDCDRFGAPWTWDAANGICWWDAAQAVGSGNLSASDCAYVSAKHHGDASGRDIYNLGSVCTFAP